MLANRMMMSQRVIVFLKELWSFGSNFNGRTGLNINTGDTLVPTQVGTDIIWASCSAGFNYSLAVKTDGTLWSFGANSLGVTGLGASTGDTLVPTQVGIAIWASCSAGGTHSLAIKTDGTLWSFGTNLHGATGRNTTTGNTLSPAKVGFATNWSNCSAGDSHSLAVKRDGTLWSFGSNDSGKTGLNLSGGTTLVPNQVGTDIIWASCSAGFNYSLAVKRDGTLWAFGANGSGQLGLGASTGDTLVPTQVGTDTNWASCDAGSDHSLAVKTDGTLWSFGSNINGPTGLGISTGNTLVPTQVGTTTNWSNCSAGNGYSLAVKRDGTLWSFGSNLNGRTGLNTTTGDTLVPTQVGINNNWVSCSAGDVHALSG